MFEKEAEEIAVNNAKKKYGLEGSVCMNIQECAYVNGFQDGAEFGYNKANEWHYVKDRDLPKENKRYLCKIKAFVGGGISYECFDYDTEYSSWKDAFGEVIAWCEIPKYTEWRNDERRI